MERETTSIGNGHAHVMDVQLHYEPLGLINAVTRWISEEGAQIETGRVALQRLSEVELTFAQPGVSKTTYHRLRAHVAHYRHGVATLRLLRCSRAAHQALRELMSGTTP